MIRVGKREIFVAVGAMALSSAFAAPRTDWSLVINNSTVDTVGGIDTDSAGNLYVATASGPNADAKDILVTKLSPAGRVLWRRSLATPGSGPDSASLKVDRSNNVYVFGSMMGPGTARMEAVVVKLASDGRVLWRSAYNGVAGQDDFYTTLALDASGGIVLSGSASRPGTGRDAFVRRLNPANGAQVWINFFAGPGTTMDLGEGVAVDPTGAIIHSVYSANFSAPSRSVFRRLSANGATLWTRIFSSPTRSLSSDWSLDSMGNPVLGQNSRDSDGMGLGSVLKLRASNGATLWGPLLDAVRPGVDQSVFPLVDRLNNVVSFWRNSTFGPSGAVATVKIIRYSSTGARLWDRTVSSPGLNLFATSGVADAAGTFWFPLLEVNSVARFSRSFLVRYTPGGSQVFRHLLAHPSGRSLMVMQMHRTSAGVIYTLGESATGTSSDVVVHRVSGG